MRALVLLAVALCAAPAASQQSVEARMRSFTHAVADGAAGRAAGFFPRRGTWTWHLTTHDGARGDRLGVWRFDAGETGWVIEDGPACGSFLFHRSTGDQDPLADEAVRDARPWRHVRGNRFVPHGAPAGSPVFVQWRREAGVWVVSAFGDERWTRPPLLGLERNEGRRDPVRGEPLARPLPPGTPHADTTRWFVENQPITLEGIRYVKYGLPRTLAPGDMARVASLDGVGLYAETGATRPWEALFAPVGPGLVFQPYTATGSPPCYDPGAPVPG